jgi:glycosyltransferase involved in cell wall biosynthesis
VTDGWSSWLSRRLVAPSPEIADAYRRAFHLPEKKMRVIPNAPAAAPPPPGFDRNAFRSSLLGADGTHLVVTVARLQPEKGIGDLVDATARIADELPGLRVLVAGAGPEEQALRERITGAGLDGVVTLLGARSDVGQLLAAADAFCLPSRHEGLPISLLEAMSAGIPCVATRVGGIPGLVVDGEHGLLVPAADVGALAGALSTVLSEPETAARIGRQGQALVEQRYGLSAVAGAYADLYDELAGTGRS